MSDENKIDTAVLPTTPELPKVDVKMSKEEILKQVETYRATADASLAKIQQSIDKVSEQLNNLQKMRLMISGQRELIIDLYNRMTGQVEQPDTATQEGN